MTLISLLFPSYMDKLIGHNIRQPKMLRSIIVAFISFISLYIYYSYNSVDFTGIYSQMNINIF